MRKICAWCGKDLDRRSEPTTAADGPVSHGICSECVDFLIHNDRQSLEAFLNRLPPPVLLVDAQNAVILSNESARRTFGPARGANHDGSAPLIGDVIECAHAMLPGGCGETLHCAGCQIRHSVRWTQQTGMAFRNVEAYRDVHGPEGDRRLKVRISTEKLGQAVLLRIEAVPQSSGLSGT